VKKIAFLFPGQASQYVGMVKDLFDHYPQAKDYINSANEILKFDLKKIVFEGPEEKLKKTHITQPAVFVHSIILNEILKEKGIAPEIAAGHSLGEYSAVVSSSALDFDDGLRLVKKRGELMHEADEKSPGTMAAILGLEREKVEELCDEISRDEVLILANYNSPKQYVISGSIAGVEKGMTRAKEMGAKRVVPLVVGGAFHSPLMHYAQKGLSEAIDSCTFKKPLYPVVSNVTAVATADITEIKNNLKAQLLNAVRWEDSIHFMINSGISSFLEVGPKKVLQGLIRQIDREVEYNGVDTKEDIEIL